MKKTIAIIIATLISIFLITLVRMRFDDITIFANNKWKYYFELGLYEMPIATFLVTTFIVIPYFLIVSIMGKYQKDEGIFIICGILGLLVLCLSIGFLLFFTHDFAKIIFNWGVLSQTVVAFLYPILIRTISKILPN